MTVFYYNQRIQNKINKGKWHIGQSLGAQASKSPLSVEVRRTYLNAPAVSCTIRVKCHLQGKLIENSMPRVFVEG